MATVTLRLFAQVREAAGTGSTSVEGTTVGEVLAAAADRFGSDYRRLAEGCKVWRNGEPATPDDPVEDGDEVAVLPPVSGGCR